MQAFIVLGIIYTSKTATLFTKGGPKTQYRDITPLDFFRSMKINQKPQAETGISPKIHLNSTTSKEEEQTGKNIELPFCPAKSPLLIGYKDVDLVTDPKSHSQVEKENPLVSNGGFYTPPDCKAIHKIAIIIPFRNRDRHLDYFLQYMHPILQRQQAEYKIYVVNQYGMDTFNKDKLMNVGYVEAVKDGFECYSFHDVDVVLTNDNCPYKCMDKPVHLAHSIDKFGGLIYTDYFGGALAMSKEQFERINGMSNIFWGWGGEDDDIVYRIKAAGMSYTRHPSEICKYKMVKHQRDKGNEINPQRFDLLNRVNSRYRTDGLNNLQYKIVQKDVNPLYTNITVDVLAPKDVR